MHSSRFLVETPSVYQFVDLFLIEAVTHLHVGVGRASGAVDLPIQRDEYGFPCIYSSSLKGAFKTAMLWAFYKKLNNLGNARKLVEVLLGPEPESEESFESSVAILDARLLAMPVRSLRGIYTYVTSPHLLKRLQDYMILSTSADEKLKKNIEELLKKADQLNQGKYICIGDCNQLRVDEVGGKIILLEEFWLDRESSSQPEPPKELLNKFKLEKPLLILHDDDVREVVNRALIRLTRVRLKPETKTVHEGGLWTEEYVPMKTRFFTVMLFKKPPASKQLIRNITTQENIDDDTYIETLTRLGVLTQDTAKEVKEKLQQNNVDVSKASEIVVMNLKNTLQEGLRVLNNYIIVGGHETIGRGIIKLEVV